MNYVVQDYRYFVDIERTLYKCLDKLTISMLLN